MQLFVSLLLAALSFGSPVHIHVQLAGNFGEPRPNHFHGGIDVKTERGVNFGIYSIADGYVSRAIVGEYGFGKALVIAHPNGYSSFYVHLNRFAPQVQAAVERWQYAHHSYNGDIHFQPGEIPVSKGQFVALSGNTGASQGPHLHLEMHQTATGNLMDPLNWLSHIVPDTEAPTAYSFKSYPQAGQGVFQNTQESRIYSFGNTRYRAWGKVGFGTWAYDHMDSVYNNYGVRHTELYCDGKLIYKSDVNNIPQRCNRMINVWGDYEHFASHRIWYLKSFREPGNRLPFITTNATGGIVNFNQPREYYLQYVFSDYYGNKTVKDIYVQGTPQAIPPAQPIGGANALLVNRNNNVAFGSALLQVKGSLLARNCLLQPQQTTLANALSAGYRFAPLSLPLLAYTPLKIKITAPIEAIPQNYIWLP
jgi:peptidase, M23 family